MFLCLRVDLDYVPWDTPDAKEFGHGEPALLLRLLDYARESGLKVHAFASERALRAFSSLPDAILGEGHHLDWLCKHPEQEARFREAQDLFKLAGSDIQGLALKQPWPEGFEPAWLSELHFVSGPEGHLPPRLHPFRVETSLDREASRGGQTSRAWTDQVKRQLREAASRNHVSILPVRPQVLARYDPKLDHLSEIIDIAIAVGLKVRTMREILAETKIA
jgi:hypothetical protein